MEGCTLDKEGFGRTGCCLYERVCCLLEDGYDGGFFALLWVFGLLGFGILGIGHVGVFFLGPLLVRGTCGFLLVRSSCFFPTFLFRVMAFEVPASTWYLSTIAHSFALVLFRLETLTHLLGWSWSRWRD